MFPPLNIINNTLIQYSVVKTSWHTHCIKCQISLSLIFICPKSDILGRQVVSEDLLGVLAISSLGPVYKAAKKTHILQLKTRRVDLICCMTKKSNLKYIIFARTNILNSCESNTILHKSER